ncbi:MAG: cytochrome c maturation protein CcmE [Candidatus Poseidoniaceae archaeon]|nr:cytochrome c maturation protein CcmE [Candidatus Poseidoniaceae archaeon]
MFTRRTRLLITGGLLTLIILGAVILQSPEPTRTVDELMDDPSVYVGEEIAIRGEVKDGTIDNSTMTFMLHGSNSEILVDFVDASVSNGLDDNRTVYAKGVLKLIDSNYVFEAEIIKTSCPSKYEE